MSGPLEGIRVIELGAIGPLPFTGMLLSDLGADVVRVDRPRRDQPPDEPAEVDVLGRGRRSVVVDLKHPDGADTLLAMVERADCLLEGFRPGVAERLGIGPDVCLARRPTLVYGRMTGWGQEGPLAHAAGHDINYVSLAGALHPIGRRGEAPVPPLNLIGDYAGGMLMAFGVVSAILRARESGEGQVVDTAMVDTAALLTTFIHELSARGEWKAERGTNLLDTGAPFYDVYQTADGRYVSVGALETRFYEELAARLGIDASRAPGDWPRIRRQLASVFRTRTQAEWCDILEGTDACFAPVLSPAEAATHPHNVARRVFVDVGGVTQPGPAPRFSATPAVVRRPGVGPGHDTDEVLADWGFSPAAVAGLKEAGVVR